MTYINIFWRFWLHNDYMDIKMKFSKFSLNFGWFFNKLKEFWWFLTFFEVLNSMMTKWISRWNFPNFLSILGDFSTNLRNFDGFWHFWKFWTLWWLNGYQDEISQIFSQFWGIFQQISRFSMVFGIFGSFELYDDQMDIFRG